MMRGPEEGQATYQMSQGFDEDLEMRDAKPKVAYICGGRI